MVLSEENDQLVGLSEGGLLVLHVYQLAVYNGGLVVDLDPILALLAFLLDPLMLQLIFFRPCLITLLSGFPKLKGILLFLLILRLDPMDLIYFLLLFVLQVLCIVDEIFFFLLLCEHEDSIIYCYHQWMNGVINRNRKISKLDPFQLVPDYIFYLAHLLPIESGWLFLLISVHFPLSLPLPFLLFRLVRVGIDVIFRFVPVLQCIHRLGGFQMMIFI